MPKDTDRLNLPLPLGNENVTRESINAIFEKIDAGVATQDDLDALREAVSKMDIPDASLMQKGKVQLSNKTDGTSEAVAATEKAVRDAATAAETNAKNASLPRAGGEISGPLTISSWGSISAGTSGFFLMGHNCYIHPTNNKYYYKQTHSNLGARGIIFRLGQAGVYTFETGPISTVKDTEFTPSLVRMPTQTDYDTLFQSGVNAKRGIVDALNALGVSASTDDTWSSLSSRLSEGNLFGVNTGIPIERIAEAELKSTMTLNTGIISSDVCLCQDKEGNITYIYNDGASNLYEIRNISRDGLLRWKVSDQSGFSKCVVNDVTNTVLVLASTYTDSWKYALRTFNKDTGASLGTIPISAIVSDMLELDDYGNAYFHSWGVFFKYSTTSGQLIYKVDTGNSSSNRPWSLDRKLGALYTHGSGLIRKINSNGVVDWAYSINDSQILGLCAGEYNGKRVLYVRNSVFLSAVAIGADSGVSIASFSNAFSGGISHSSERNKINNFVVDNQGGFTSYSTSPNPEYTGRHIPTLTRSKENRRKLLTFTNPIGWESYHYRGSGIFNARDMDVSKELIFYLYGIIYVYKINYRII
ncbi:tail fiber protein [Paenibacillus barcinonensis]|uniref:Tail fiber protein n=1 Tax=Paenibacillus barcinonensis TaxID=198119 RepID=A0A2V4VU90_PAEBA|nr:tail fiber protein [Paenibacillus barcinonensis]PYE48493.1 tail fiber-like repeat protein [Paenibacillus barcinonensis]QKS58800.1 tail fiber protein [Paenibacillus barcinonensis]